MELERFLCSATYKDSYTTAGYKLADNKISYVNASGGATLATVSGVKSLNGISLNNKVVTLSNASLDGKEVTINGTGYTLALGNDVTKTSTTNAGWSLNGSSATYKDSYTTAGYKLADNKISYVNSSGGSTLATVTGVKSLNGISLNNKTVTISAKSLNGKPVTLTGDYTLALGSDVATSAKQITGSFTSFSNGTAKFKSTSFSDFYTLSGKTISYTPTVSGKDITIAGLNKSLTLKHGAIAGIISSYSNGVTTFKIKAEDLTTGNVTLTGDGKLQLDGYKKPANVAATFVKGVYTQAYTPAFYTATDKKITYTAKTGGDKFTITGLKSSATPLKSNTGIKVDSKGVVTISATSLDGKSVTLVNDTADGVNKITYKLAVDSSVKTKSTTTKATWTKKNSTFTYTAPITSAFYTLKGNALNYTAKKGGEHFSVSGLKNTNAVSVSGKKVTIGNASLDDKAVTLTGDYTLALAKDVATSAKKTAGSFSTVSKGTATYKATSFSGYYKISGKKISYTAPTGGQAITLKNLNTSANLAAVKKGITIAEQSNGIYKITFQHSSVLTTKAPTVSVAKGVKYTVAVADSLKPVTKAAAWNISGTSAVLRSETTAGYTVSKNAVVYSAKKNGSPLMELTNLAKNVKTNAITTKGKVVTLNSSVLGSKTTVKSNSGKYQINLTGNMSKKQFTATSAADTLTVAANNANVDTGAGNDVVTVSGLQVTLNGGAGNDTLTITGKNAVVHGGSGADTIKSTSSGATINGGGGDDQLWGNKKFADVFIYTANQGIDRIFNYSDSDMLKILNADGSNGKFKSSKYSGGDLTLTINGGGKIILENVSASTKFNLNGTNYQISGTKLVRK